MAPTPPPASRIFAYGVLLLSVPAGFFLGRTLDELTSWHPAPPPPRPRYLSTTPQPLEKPATMVPSKPTTQAASVRYHSEWATYAAAVAESKRTGKPVMIDFSADWCGPCQQLRAEVFANDVLCRQVQNVVIPVSIVDRKRERGFNGDEADSLQRLYRANAFPTLIVVSARTGLMTRTQGFLGAGATVAWIRESAQVVR